MHYTDIDKQLSTLTHNIIILRKQHDLSKKAMARLLNVSLYSLCKLEKGHLSNVDISVLFAIQDHFGIAAAKLFEKRLEQKSPDAGASGDNSSM